MLIADRRYNVHQTLFQVNAILPLDLQLEPVSARVSLCRVDAWIRGRDSLCRADAWIRGRGSLCRADAWIHGHGSLCRADAWIRGRGFGCLHLIVALR